MKWVEVDVILDPDGKAMMKYTVQWSCQNANLHGFYFEGFSGQPIFDNSQSYALDQSGNRYELEIKRLSSNKYDVVLANGQAFHNGEIAYVLQLEP